MDDTNSKNNGTAMYPVHANQVSGLLRRCEPFLTAAMLKSRYLKGIPLQFPNGDEFSDDDLTDKIMLAMNEAELLIGTTITREQFREKLPFDMALYNAFMHMKTEHGPIISLEELAIVASNNVNIYQVPSSWIETANFSKNLINVIPLLAAFGSTSVSGTPVGANGQNVGAAFLAIWTAYGNAGQVPAYWQVTYTAGVSNKEGQVPIAVNELIGVIAAMAILSLIAPSNIYNSQSLSQDGISQSSSGPGVNLYVRRLEELEKKKQELISKLKAIFSRRYFIGNI